MRKTVLGKALVAVVGAALLTNPLSAQEHIDRVFVNGRVWTGESARPQAEAIAIAGDKIVAVGSTVEIRRMVASDTAVVDLAGRRVVPGFQDSHIHFNYSGNTLDTVELHDITTVAELQSRLKAFAAAHPDLPWIKGFGWGYSIFPNQVPDRKYIDAAVSDRPVYLSARDGHMGLANSRALAAAGLTAETKDPPNGHIVKAADGQPTGELKESAQRLVTARIPPPSAQVKYNTLIKHMDEAAAAGLTSVHDAKTDMDDIPLFERANAAGALKLRFAFAPPIIPNVGGSPPEHHLKRPVTDADLAPYIALRDTLRGPLLKLMSVKGSLDGTVDAQTALMFEPYVGTTTKGIAFWESDELNRTVALYDRLGFQVMLHAIGDRSINDALNAFAYARKTNGTSGRRHRVEHAEVPKLEDLARFRALGVIASTQPMFANPDETVLKNFDPLLGPARAPHADSFKIFDDAGVVQAFGSDWPVFPFSPIAGIHAAVNRMTPEGTPPGGWHPKGRITVEAALRHYTRDGAYAVFDEAIRGTLAKGKLADFVVLSQDILTIPPTDIIKTKVLLTVMGGRDTYRAPGF